MISAIPDVQQVGLRIDSHDPEYPILVAVESSAERDTDRDRCIIRKRLNRYADPSFKPCAIICTICGGRTQLNGLNLFGSYDGLVDLYMGDTYSLHRREITILSQDGRMIECSVQVGEACFEDRE